MIYSEIFRSIQGEGLYLGTPSVFLRLFGCNFRCRKFGRPKTEEIGKYNPEVEEIIKNIDQYKEFKDLPLVKTGCDTYAAIYPEFKRFSQSLRHEEVRDKVAKLLPSGKFGINEHLILTGGEPLLPGWQKQIPALIKLLRSDLGLTHLTIETNGTQALIKDFVDFCIWAFENEIEITFSVSSKLSVSGESWEAAIKPDVIEGYLLEDLRDFHPEIDECHRIYFKWVIQDRSDIEEVKKAIATYNMPQIPVYLMPVGGTTDLYNLTHKEVALIAEENGWRYSPRAQIELFGNKWGT